MSRMNDGIERVTRDVWSAQLGMIAVPSPSDGFLESTYLRARVEVHGTWDGVVHVDCPLPLARRAAEALYGTPSLTLPLEEVEDAVGELANITSGGLKAFLGAASRLSLPAVRLVDDDETPPPARAPLGELAFRCEGQVFRVTVRG
jgi:hypothetical protein